jgi:hypothetical protein
MASKRPNYYKISSVFKRPNRKWFSFSLPSKRRSRLLIGVIAVYLVIASLLGGMFLYSGFQQSSEAEDVAFISASIRFEQEKQQYKIGDEVKVFLTLQNTSITETINNLEADFLSTRDAIEWKSSKDQNNSQTPALDVSNKQTFQYGILSNGERGEHLVSGFLKDDQVDILTILVRVRYKNALGQQETNTNTIATNLQSGKLALNNNVNIRSNKEEYTTGEEISILGAIVDFELSANQFPKGKFFINQDQSVQTRTILDCVFIQNKTCINRVDGLKPGNYTAMFISDDQKVLSNIITFTIKGEGEQSISPSSATSLNLPFGLGSINGIAPIVANRVLSQNEAYNPNMTCKFEIFREENKVTDLYASLKQDRSCRTELSIGLVGGQSGVYKIRLAGSSFEKFVSILPPSVNTLPIINLTSKPETGQPIKIKVSDIFVDKSGSKTTTQSIQNTRILPQPEELLEQEEQRAKQEAEVKEKQEQEQENSSQISEARENTEKTPTIINPTPTVSDLLKSKAKKAKIRIYDRFREKLTTIEGINGLPILSNEETLEVEIPGDYFTKSGIYQISVELEDGQQSDFLTISLGNNTGYYSLEGIQVDDFSNLRVGKAIKFSVNNIVDFSGQKIPTGSCESAIYINSNSLNPEVLSGQIVDGKCEVQLPAGRITKSGPILVSFTGLGVNNKINQSEQFFISPEAPQNYGGINFEYEPVRQKQANNIIIGPITDKYGNLASGSNYQLVFSTGEFIPELIQDIPVNNGFATVTFASSLTEYEELILAFRNSAGEELLRRNVVPVSSREKLILPILPTEVQSNQQIGASLTSIELFEEAECILSWQSNSQNYQEIRKDYDFNNSRCDFAWNLTQARETDRALISLQLGDRKFNQIVELKNTDPANIFAITPQARLNTNNELEIYLLTSPIVDLMGLPIKQGKLNWQYNGKVRESDIVNGFSYLKLLAGDLSKSDIRQTYEGNSGQRYLDLDLDVKASIASLSQTNNISIYLDNYDIANYSNNFEPISASNYAKQFSQSILRFRSPACQALSIDEKKQVTNLPSHKQGDECFVELDTQSLGQKTLVLTKNGFRLASFDYSVGTLTEGVEWCKDVTGKRNCFVQIKSPAVFDAKVELKGEGGDVYTFISSNLENTIEIKGDGLNPLKSYTLELTYKNLKNQEIKAYQTIIGEDLLERK